MVRAHYRGPFWGNPHKHMEYVAFTSMDFVMTESISDCANVKLTNHTTSKFCTPMCL